MSVELSEKGKQLEYRVSRLEKAIKNTLDREGRYGAYENFYGVMSFHLDDFSLDELHPLQYWRNSLAQSYKKCFDVVHCYGAGGAWVYLLGDVLRPLDDPRPLIIDVLPGAIDIHPGQVSSGQIEALNPSILTDVSNLLSGAILEFSGKLPNGIEPMPNTTSADEIKAWGEASKSKLQSQLNELKSLPDTPGRRLTTEAIIVALGVIVSASSYYGLVKPIFDNALEILAAREEARAEAERRTIENRR
jgi:hypothetical protein